MPLTRTPTRLGPRPGPRLDVNSPGDDHSGRVSYCYLPDDIILHVLLLVDLRSLATCRRVCRNWNSLVAVDISLQYKMELGACGMVDGPRQTGENVAERLEKLRCYHSRWLSGTLNANRFIPHYPAVGTSWIASPSYDGSVQWLTPSDSSITTVVLHSLPSKFRGLQERRWRMQLGNPGSQLIHVVTDIAQNLLVTVERPSDSSDFIVNMLSLEAAGGAPHPDAASAIVLVGPRIKAHRNPGLYVSIQEVTVCGRYIAWHIISRSSNLEIWDWTTGKLVWLRKFKSIFFYTFLDSSYIAVVDRAYGSREHVEIYRFAPPAAGTPPTHQASLTELDGHICDLQLPPPRVASTQIFTGRLACYATRPGATPAGPRVPFQDDPTSAVLAVQYSLRSGNGSDNHSFELLVPLRTIYRQIDLALARHAFRPSDTVKWIHWGPRGSVLLHRGRRFLQPPPYLTLTPFGHRYPVMLYDQESPELSGRVFVLDFSRGAIRRTGGRPPRGEGAKELAAAGAFRGPWEDYFATSVRSKLAYDVIVGPQVSFPEPSNSPWALRMHLDGFALLYMGYSNNDRTLGIQSFSI